MIGFLTTLISVVAKLETGGRLGGDRLGLTQLSAWMVITGLPDDQIGEEICLLSANSDVAFLDGCRNALSFIKAFKGQPDPDDAGALNLHDSGELLLADAGERQPRKPEEFGPGGYLTAAFWSSYFDDRVR